MIDFGPFIDGHTCVLDADSPMRTLAHSAPSLMVVSGVFLFVILPVINHGARALSRRLEGYRILPATRKDAWDQSVTMTMIVPTILFAGYAQCVYLCSGNTHSRFDGYVPFSRFGVYNCIVVFCRCTQAFSFPFTPPFFLPPFPSNVYMLMYTC